MNAHGAYIVTGAGSGIGRAISHTIIENGGVVVGLGRSLEKLKSTASEAKFEDRFYPFSLDLSQAQAVADRLPEIQKHLLKLELPLVGLVNNAGIFERLDFTETTDAVWLKYFENNFMSAVRVTRWFFPELQKHPSAVLNISSTLGLRPIAQTSAYSAVKAAMVNWTQALAIEWASYSIRVNCICPGLVDTPVHEFFGLNELTESRQVANKAQPLGRMGRPADIAEAAWFLLNEKSSWTTGTVMTVDGGINL